jgi:hypothetical protein
MQYPKVDHSHIVPEHYLENFAIGGMIAMRLVGWPTSKSVSTRDAAVRKAFYSRTRPDGSRIDDVEWSLAQLEGVTAELLRNVAAAWPPERDTKSKLAELFAYQLIRGPQWKDWHEDFTRRFTANYQRDEAQSAEDHVAIEVAGQHLLTDTPRLTRMLSLGTKITAILASMHWTLLEFDRPWVVTSDHPVVMWPFYERARAPQPTSMNAGVLETLEVRVPISPQQAILMTCSDDPDDESPYVRGRRDHAANLNAFTIAQADPQWFHQPGASTPAACGRLLPLSTQLFHGYTAAAASSSRRRDRTSAIVQPMIGIDLDNRDIEVVTMTRNT